MGAMHNDLNRCNFMYADDRRCRNLIQNPGNPFCFYHCEAARKKNQAATPAQADPADDDVATRAFLEWLSLYPLDTATNLNRALNQLFLLLLRNRISGRQADHLLRTIRLMLTTVPDLRDEFQRPGLRAHAPQGDHFLAELREMTAFAASQDEESTPHQEDPQAPPQDQKPALQNHEPLQNPSVDAALRSQASLESSGGFIPPDFAVQESAPQSQQPHAQDQRAPATFPSPAFAESQHREPSKHVALQDADHSDSDVAPFVLPASFVSASDRPG